ncbi:hypothetical protein SAMD00019534_070540, partial [Acytostelium subglobosum LB1]|uniref:hypothetical protein n=1 Tax=Acytostelium subglobosum LB1 TaxID=1410327 RepID=UPI000644D850
ILDMSTDLLVMGASLFIMNKIDFKDPVNAHYALIGYGIVQVITVAVYLYIYQTIASKPKNNNKIDIHTPASLGQDQSNNRAKTERMTIEEYDMAQVKKIAMNVVIGILLPLFLYNKWGIIQPLAFNILFGLQNLYKNNLVKVYIFGKDIPRPFVEANPLAGMFGGMGGAAPEEQANTTRSSADSGNIDLGQSEQLESSANKKTEKAAAKAKKTKKIIEVNSDDEEKVSDDEDDSSSKKSPQMRRKK